MAGSTSSGRSLRPDRPLSISRNPLSPAPTGKKRGWREKTKPRNLLEGPDQHGGQALSNLYDLCVLFVNNLAEWDIRGMMVRQRIPGLLRSEAGVKTFCRIRNYISTVHQNAIGVLDAISCAFTGERVRAELQHPVAAWLRGTPLTDYPPRTSSPAPGRFRTRTFPVEDQHRLPIGPSGFPEDSGRDEPPVRPTHPLHAQLAALRNSRCGSAVRPGRCCRESAGTVRSMKLTTANDELRAHLSLVAGLAPATRQE